MGPSPYERRRGLHPQRSNKEALTLSIHALRRRIARWLVGPFVTLPEREGVWIVFRNANASTIMTIEADKFRLKSGINLSRNIYDDSLAAYIGNSRRWGRFVGTVKYRA